MRRCLNSSIHKKSRGMTLIEVVVALGVLVLVFAMFSMFLNTATNMNTQAMAADSGLAEAELKVYSGAPSGNGKVTFSLGGDVLSYNVNIYSGASSDGEVELGRFAP